jgi:hypothetical protein
MIIREATTLDIIDIVSKTMKPSDKVPFIANRVIPIDGTATAMCLNILITNPQKNSVVFIAEDETEGIVGAMGGHIEPYSFNRQYLMAREDFRQAIVGAKVTWKLIAAFEEWAKKLGASAVLLAERISYTNKSLEPYMESLGYKLLERMYLKEVI